ncbi:hypothetical protein [Bifidobacterium jacchi]|uniref:Uncharacterized protein n=1 Tax=Bifidobacterium jacchi TaxID=2490545 RepID=A0A5N5RL08_9BIFI|nr:hypothetical protein [Bifidobacterium jacchi]KAB5608015.1 hypothetical protein EHS19_02520 [Bifidobacterium jacchi]
MPTERVIGVDDATARRMMETLRDAYDAMGACDEAVAAADRTEQRWNRGVAWLRTFGVLSLLALVAAGGMLGMVNDNASASTLDALAVAGWIALAVASLLLIAVVTMVVRQIRRRGPLMRDLTDRARFRRQRDRISMAIRPLEERLPPGLRNRAYAARVLAFADAAAAVPAGSGGGSGGGSGAGAGAGSSGAATVSSASVGSVESAGSVKSAGSFGDVMIAAASPVHYPMFGDAKALDVDWDAIRAVIDGIGSDSDGGAADGTDGTDGADGVGGTGDDGAGGAEDAYEADDVLVSTPSSARPLAIAARFGMSMICSLAAFALSLATCVYTVPSQRSALAAAADSCSQSLDDLWGTVSDASWASYVSVHDVGNEKALKTLQSSRLQGVSVYSCADPRNAGVAEILQTVSEIQDQNTSLEQLVKSTKLKSRDDYALGDILAATSDGSYRSIAGDYCTKGGSCVHISESGTITVAADSSFNPLQSKQDSSELSPVAADQHGNDYLYKRGLGLLFLGPEDELQCIYGSGSVCDDLPSSDITARPVRVMYFPKGVNVAALESEMCYLECRGDFVPPDASRPFLLIPVFGGAVGTLNDPADANAYYLQSDDQKN